MFYSTGRRKESVVNITIKKGKGTLLINNNSLLSYFSMDLLHNEIDNYIAVLLLSSNSNRMESNKQCSLKSKDVVVVDDVKQQGSKELPRNRQHVVYQSKQKQIKRQLDVILKPLIKFYNVLSNDNTLLYYIISCFNSQTNPVVLSCVDRVSKGFLRVRRKTTNHSNTARFALFHKKQQNTKQSNTSCLCFRLKKRTATTTCCRLLCKPLQSNENVLGWSEKSCNNKTQTTISCYSKDPKDVISLLRKKQAKECKNITSLLFSEIGLLRCFSSNALTLSTKSNSNEQKQQQQQRFIKIFQKFFNSIDIFINVKGGGFTGQLSAIQLALSRCLFKILNKSILCSEANTNKAKQKITDFCLSKSVSLHSKHSKQSNGFCKTACDLKKTGAKQKQKQGSVVCKPLLLFERKKQNTKLLFTNRSKTKCKANAFFQMQNTKYNKAHILELKKNFKSLLKRDCRIKERRKYGYLKARKKTQYHKR